MKTVKEPKSSNDRQNAFSLARANHLVVFQTKLGWMAAAWVVGELSALTVGHRSPQQAVSNLPDIPWDGPAPEPDPGSGDAFVARMQAYANGFRDEFRDLPIATAGATEFQQRVLDHCRSIRYGLTLSYAQLAKKAGSPGAARAVGNIMARNRIPLIIPCHRVVGSGGSLGGYSAPQGLIMKRRLLSLENGKLNEDHGTTDSNPEACAERHNCH